MISPRYEALTIGFGNTWQKIDCLVSQTHNVGREVLASVERSRLVLGRNSTNRLGEINGAIQRYIQIQATRRPDMELKRTYQTRESHHTPEPQSV